MGQQPRTAVAHDRPLPCGDTQLAAVVRETPVVARAEHDGHAQHTTLTIPEGCIHLDHRRCACHRKLRQPQGPRRKHLGKQAGVPRRLDSLPREPVVGAIRAAGGAAEAPAAACGGTLAGVAMMSDQRGRGDLFSAGLGAGPGRASKNRNTWCPPIYIHIYIHIYIYIYIYIGLFVCVCMCGVEQY